MFYLEEQCYKDIAQHTGLTMNEVKSNIQNGKRNLKICLEKNRERYDQGLIKLRETAQQVAEIEIEVKEKQIEAEIKKNEADAFA